MTARLYPVRLFWVFDYGAPAIEPLLVLAASPSCAIGKACDNDPALAMQRHHLHSILASFSR